MGKKSKKVLPEETKMVNEFEFGRSSKAQRKRGDKLIKEFNFTAAPGLKNVIIPVLTPQIKEDVPGPEEDVFDEEAQQNIQGNIIPGFNKDHQHFLFFKITAVNSCKGFLRSIADQLSPMGEVMAFVRWFRARNLRQGESGAEFASTWVNIAFSHSGIARLLSEETANEFGEESFRQGLAARSTYLGDPVSAKHPGHTSNWVVGGRRKNEADIIIIVASDLASMLDGRVATIKAEVSGAGMSLIFEQRGDTLPRDLRGHEHFGFKDGVSQPGIRGKLSSNPGDYITPRYSMNSLYGKPGQLLVWPGEFLLGQTRHNSVLDVTLPADRIKDTTRNVDSDVVTPEWARNGSYLVVRRLRQDVRLFWNFVAYGASKAEMSPIKFASMLVGRWPSGAPLMRAPGEDNPALGRDLFANNHFIFDDDTGPSSLRDIPGYAGDSYPNATADYLARVCPHFAHIRKMNPRDGATDTGGPPDTIIRYILRRGIPYGRPLIGKNPSKELVNEDRGLMFLCYCSSIETQFEFLQRHWANSPVSPNFGGFDPIIGQNGREVKLRKRFIEVPTDNETVRVPFNDDWVIPTGGGYFFAPTISAIRDVLASV